MVRYWLVIARVLVMTESDILRGALIDWVAGMVIAGGGAFLLVCLL